MGVAAVLMAVDIYRNYPHEDIVETLKVMYITKHLDHAMLTVFFLFVAADFVANIKNVSKYSMLGGVSSFAFAAIGGLLLVLITDFDLPKTIGFVASPTDIIVVIIGLWLVRNFVSDYGRNFVINSAVVDDGLFAVATAILVGPELAWELLKGIGVIFVMAGAERFISLKVLRNKVWLIASFVYMAMNVFHVSPLLGAILLVGLTCTSEECHQIEEMKMLKNVGYLGLLGFILMNVVVPSGNDFLSMNSMLIVFLLLICKGLPAIIFLLLDPKEELGSRMKRIGLGFFYPVAFTMSFMAIGYLKRPGIVSELQAGVILGSTIAFICALLLIKSSGKIKIN